MRKLFVLIILILAACGPTVLVPIATPTLNLIPSPIPGISPGSNLCVTPRDLGAPVTPSSPKTVGTMKSIILNYLNQGGNPEKLVSELTAPTYGSLKLKLTRIDFNHDGVDELAFSFAPNGTSAVGALTSVFWIFQCRGGEYVSVFTTLEGGNIVDGDPAVIDVEDLKGDKQKEAVVQSSQILKSECRETFDIFASKKDDITDYLGPLINFPCGTKFSVGDSDQNGNKDILFTGQSDLPSDAVAGIQRQFVDTYVLKDNQSYKLKSHGYLPSPYRVHVIYDAQQALDEGDLDQALQLYTQAANDEALQDINSFCVVPGTYACTSAVSPQKTGTVDHPREYLSAFALFRLTLLYLQNGDAQAFASTLNELDKNYPAGEYGYEFVSAAHLLKKQVKAGKSLASSCNVVTSMIEKYYPFLYLHFEWSTPSRAFYYTNDTFCSFGI